MTQHHEQETRETLPQPKVQAPVKHPAPDRPGWFKTAIRRLAVWLYNQTKPLDTNEKTFVYDRIRAVAKRVNNAETALHARIALLIMADFEELRWTEGAKALMADLKEIEAQGGFIGGFAPDQWREIEAAIRKAWFPPVSGVIVRSNFNDFTAEVRRNLEQRDGGSPS